MPLRRFGKDDWRCSALGFGAMRLPVDKSGNPDAEESVRMIRHAIDRGVNYVDTAYPYHDEKSEGIVGLALKNGYREKVRIATKSPIWLLEKTGDFDRILDIQLKRLDSGPIDYYLFHAVWKDRWEKIKSLKLFDAAERAMDDGRIRHLGFSFHDQFPLFREIVDAYDNWTLAQIQYNFLYDKWQAGTAGLKYAAEKGLAVVVMEPLLGGQIARPNTAVREVWDKSGKQPADVALRWIWNKPGVSTVLSGMSAMNQVDANLESAYLSGIGKFTEEEETLIAGVKAVYANLPLIGCTDCKYCMPCPHGVDIPRNFEIYNESLMNADMGKALYLWHFNPGEKADRCRECGVCLEKCPQQIPITESLKKVRRRFQESS